MADKNIYTRLRRLFSSNVIVRNVGGRKLKVTDTSRIQTNPKASLVDRYTKLYTSYAGTSGYNYSLYQKTQRLGRADRLWCIGTAIEERRTYFKT